VEILPGAGGFAGSAVDDEVRGVSGHLGIEVVHEHAKGGFLEPALAGNLHSPWGPHLRYAGHVPHGSFVYYNTIMTLLQTEGLTKRFGGLKAVDSVTLALEEEEVLGLIGPNGAGKTTFINLVTGVLKPDNGAIFFKGENITHLPSHQRARLGIARTFQILRPFSALSVQDNVLTALAQKYCPQIFSTLKVRSSRHALQEVEKLLTLTGLEAWALQPAFSLPVGILRRLELARALALQPKVLLLDEPAAGLNDQELQEFCASLTRIREQFKLSIILVEHRMRFVMTVCNRIVVMHRGSLIAEGAPVEIANNPKVIEIYLGSS